MLAKAMTYTDYNGNERTETFYFNLTKAELMQWELKEVGGLRAKLEKIIASKNQPEIAEMFAEVIDKAFGIKSPDGRRLIKNPEILEEFKQTEAYSDLYMELATDAKAASSFVEQIIPTNSQAKFEPVSK